MSTGNQDYLSFQCPQCNKRLKAPPTLAGKKLSCPKCGAAIRVPGVVASTVEDDWLSLDTPVVPTAPKPQPPSPRINSDQPRASVPNSGKPTPPAPVSRSSPLDPIPLDDPEDVSAESPGAEAPKKEPTADGPIETSAQVVSSTRSVFDDDLPDLLPLEPALDTPAAPNLKKPSPKIDLPDIDLEDFGSEPSTTKPSAGKEPLLKGSLEQIALDEDAFRAQFNAPKDEDIHFPCKVCGTILYSKESRIGTKTRCPDCFSEFSIPTPIAKKKIQRDFKLDDETASVTLAPIEPSIIRDHSKATKDKTKEMLDKAAIEVERENLEIDEVSVAFDSKRWISMIFGFVRDPLVCVAAVALGVLMAVWLVLCDTAGPALKLEAFQALIVKIVLFGLGVIPVFGSICLCGLVILPMAANRETRVREWPFAKWGESLGECLLFLLAFIGGAMPGGILGTALSAFHALPAISFALTLLSIWAFTPILLLCMIENGSVFEPYSKAIVKSIGSHAEAWGAMYLQTGITMAIIFVLMVMSLPKDIFGDILLGLLFPFCAFFIFNQYGILAGRISSVTEMGFQGDFSDD